MRVNKLRVLRCVALFAAFVISGSLLMAPSAQATDTQDVVVTFTTAQAAQRASAAAGGGAPVAPTVVSFRADAATVDDLRASSGVVAVERDVAFHASDLPTQPTDPCFVGGDACRGFDAWQFDDVGVRDLWARTHGASVTIAVVDAGVDATVPEIADKLIAPEIDLTDAHDGASDHGTAVAALAAGSLDNDVASGGIAWDSRLLSVKVLDRSGTGRLSSVAAGVVRATDLGARVINLSLSGQYTTALATAVQYAIDHGVVIVAAAGNDGTDTPTVALATGTVDGGYPARYPGVVAVGATTRSHSIASFSDFGPWVDVFAPGVGLTAPIVGGTLEHFSGTSAAAPLISGIAALLVSASPSDNSAQVEGVLRTTGHAIDGVPGSVRVDASALAADAALFPGGPNSPVGVIDGVGVAPGGSVVTGWTVDPNAHDTLTVHTYVDGRPIGATVAGVARPDVGSALPGFGDAHGFVVQMKLAPGPHDICVYGINVGAGGNALISCVTTTARTVPFGAVDGAARLASTVVLTGWIIDPTTDSPAYVQPILDGVRLDAVPANVFRPDVMAAFPSFSAAHGYRDVVAISPGPHTLCMIGEGATVGPPVGLGCRSI